MTGTSVEIQFVTASSNVITNLTLEKILHKNFEEIPLPEYTQEDYDFAAAINTSINDKYTGASINDFVKPFCHSEQVCEASTDVGDVSWICPTAQITAATWASLTQAHTWQITAQGKSSLAHKSTLYAGKVLAGAAIDLLENPELIQQAKDEKNAKLEGYVNRFRCISLAGVFLITAGTGENEFLGDHRVLMFNFGIISGLWDVALASGENAPSKQKVVCSL